MRDRALQRAIDKAGGRNALAGALGISGPAISQWDRVPAERVIEVARITGVPRSQLRPDLYPPQKSSKSRDPIEGAETGAAA